MNAAPRGALGALGGTVRSESGEPVGGLKITADGPIDRTIITAADGSYRFPTLSVGDYALTATKFGYGRRTATVTENATATGDLTLIQAASGKLTGTISSAAGATVTITDTPVTATTDVRAHFEAPLPHGTYTVNATHPSRCVTSGTSHVTATGDTTVTVNLPERTDGYGYGCGATDDRVYTPGSHQLALAGDNTTERVDLPFTLPLYGKTYGQAWIGTNGTVSFGGNNTGDINGDIPARLRRTRLWDDLLGGRGGQWFRRLHLHHRHGTEPQLRDRVARGSPLVGADREILLLGRDRRGRHSDVLLQGDRRYRYRGRFHGHRRRGERHRHRCPCEPEE
ncbi:carboxypeptidase regulatory-like domain-containing protein [Streptomyces virginiae]|uniref:carboxypeptidase regulatory-like domain-containing protein n=1 Tax=Streptomyces virginiae TaxID=1961 RepID=UPI0036D17C39